MSVESPCRLYVYLAREAPFAVVLRRGPSDWTRLSLWHTDNDRFEHGQWFHGRVYERRCDVSPDGSLFAYFARKSTATTTDIDADSWIAVSRPPYFTALALWGIGMTYCAGAHFVDATTLFASWIDTPPGTGGVPNWLNIARDPPHAVRGAEWTDRVVHVNRLIAAGWIPDGDINDASIRWERRQPQGERTLTVLPIPNIDFTDYGGRSQDDYAILEPSGAIHALGRATWADWDQRGRLILAQDGRLSEWLAPDQTRTIEDFNPQRPDPQPSPPWAREWPSAPVAP